jgi:hypothetical protein
VRAPGTTNYLVDAEAGLYEEAEPSETPSSWDTKRGELLVFDDPEKRLPMIDDLEVFRPVEKGFYRRILIPATLVETIMTIPAWLTPSSRRPASISAGWALARHI